MLVTTPQAVALLDAMKCLSFTQAVNVPVLGLIENMSGYVCPCCGEISNVFSTGGGEAMAQREKIKFLGSLPVDTDLVTLLDAAEPTAEETQRKEEEDSQVSDHTDEKVDGTDSTMSTSPFALWNRYQKTATAPLFRKIAEEIERTLSQPPTRTLDAAGSGAVARS